MRRRLPSLNQLRAFEAAARPQSFSKAAEELFGYDATEVRKVHIENFYPDGVARDIMKRLRDEFGVHHVNFYDDLFTANRRRLLKLCERLAGRATARSRSPSESPSPRARLNV